MLAMPFKMAIIVSVITREVNKDDTETGIQHVQTLRKRDD